MAVYLAAPRTVSLPFSPLSSSSSSTPLQIQQNPTCSIRSCLRFPSRKILKDPISATRCINVSAASTEAVSTGKQEFLPPLEVSEIEGKCKKWVWRGCTINYFVYPESSGGSDAPALSPPLLLVHGFGASIAHWRRYIYIDCKLSCISRLNSLLICNWTNQLSKRD